MAHNFNLTELEKKHIYNVVVAIENMMMFDGDDFKYLAVGILELIYGEPKSNDIIKTIEKWVDDDDLEVEFDCKDGEEFFEKNGHLEIIQQTFTK